MANSKKANRKMIEMGNAKMLAAWKQGIAVSSPDGKRPNRVAIREASGGSISEAERLRKYRAMSVRIGKAELTQITKWCIEFDRAWGPTLLCELSKIPTMKVRQKTARRAIKEGIGLVELKRVVRLAKRSPKQDVRLTKKSPGSVKRKTTRVGRHRTLDWTQPTDVLDEIHRVCQGFLMFAIDIDRVTNSDSTIAAVVKLLQEMKPQVAAAKGAIRRLQKDCDAELKARC
jgi:hypothetical protein